LSTTRGNACFKHAVLFIDKTARSSAGTSFMFPD
jgi:hypothetical protein